MDVLFYIFIGTLSRLAPHPANITAVGALALFSGAHLSGKKALFIIALTMFLSDMVLGFHSVMWATYGSLLSAVLLGRILRKNRGVWPVISVTLSSSILFYLVTNFAVWAVPGSLYPHTISGLIDSYIMALPFFRNSLIGDFFYTGIFFVGYDMVILLRQRRKLVVR